MVHLLRAKEGLLLNRVYFCYGDTIVCPIDNKINKLHFITMYTSECDQFISLNVVANIFKTSFALLQGIVLVYDITSQHSFDQTKEWLEYVKAVSC